MAHGITLAPPDGNSKFPDFQHDHRQRPVVLYDTRKRINRRRRGRGMAGLRAPRQSPQGEATHAFTRETNLKSMTMTGYGNALISVHPSRQFLSRGIPEAELAVSEGLFRTAVDFGRAAGCPVMARNGPFTGR